MRRTVSVLRRLRLSSRRILAMAKKEFRQLVRDRLSLGFVIGIPTIQIILFGYAIDLDVRQVPTAVLDRSGSALSRELIGELAATQTFDMQRAIRSETEAIQLLESGEAGAVIIIPPELDRRLYRGRGGEISIMADATNPTVASAITLAGEGLGRRLAERVRLTAGGPRGSLGCGDGDGSCRAPVADLVRPEAFQVAVLPFYNPERRTAIFIVPGLLGTILTMTMMLMTALAIVRERERGTFEFLIATPVGRSEVMIGKIIPYLVAGHLQVALILGLGVVLFDLPIRGSLLDLGIGALPFLASMLTVGLLISSASRSQFQAMQMSFFFFLPSILLSGFMFPFEAMPEAAQWIGELLPLTHFLRIIRGIVVKGAPIDLFLHDIAAILVFTGAALGFAIAGFRKRLG